MTTQLDRVGPARAGLLQKIGFVAAPAAAIAYPWTLQAFNIAAVQLLDPAHQVRPLQWLAAGFFLACAFAVPLVGLAAALRLRNADGASGVYRRAELVALLVVAAPPIYTFLGVVDSMMRNPVPDEWTFAVLWAILGAFVLAGSQEPASPARTEASGALRAAHGVSALAIIALFLGFHLANHLAGLIGPEAHRGVMKSVRAIYGSAFAEPVLVGLMLFQVASGAVLVRRRLQRSVDGFEMFQVAAGVYVGFFLIGHMNSVFIFARSWSAPPIATDWSFATSEAWGGLIKSGWSNRLIPHYALGVFFVLAHIGSGLRGIALGHGLRKFWADRIVFAGCVVAFVLATAIMLGMCGARLELPAVAQIGK